MTLGIDATNLSGGCRNYLLALLKDFDPLSDGFQRIIVWAPLSTLELLPNKDWLVREHFPVFERNFWSRGLWQARRLTARAEHFECDLLFVPGGAYLGGFRPVVVLFQNLLPFERLERLRYWRRPLRYLKFRVLFHVYRSVLPRAVGVLFLSEHARRVICRSAGTHPRTYGVIPHGIDAGFRADVRLHRMIGACSPQDPFRILYVSSVDLYKHQWQVVHAVALLRKSTGWPLRLVLAGPGESMAIERLQSAIHRHDPQGEYVEYLGELPYASMPSIYAAADLAVFASTCENLPMILLEKMAMRLPIACAEYPAMRSLLGDDAVWFDAEDPADICSAIRRLIDDPDLRASISRNNRVKVEGYDWSTVTRDTFRFLRERVGASQAPHDD